jgi:hypothetical protein
MAGEVVGASEGVCSGAFSVAADMINFLRKEGDFYDFF